MTMHLMHPALTMGGKKKGKQKFRNADQARKARELKEQWERNKAEWDMLSSKTADKSKNYTKPLNIPKVPEGRGTRHIPSLSVVTTGAVSTKESPKYTGDNMIGIAQMAKSNAVPIFNHEHIIEVARMRR